MSQLYNCGFFLQLIFGSKLNVMRRFLLLLLLLVGFTQLYGQTYTKLRDSALNLMRGAKDSAGLRKSFDLYKKAFKQYPEKVDRLGLYKASVVAGELREFDSGFSYLERLLGFNTLSDPSWSYVAGPYTDYEFKNYKEDKRWQALVAKGIMLKNQFYKNLSDKQADFQQNEKTLLDFSKYKSGKSLYDAILAFNKFTPKKYRNYSIKTRVTDSLNTSYYLRLPDPYNPQKSYPVLFFLHGAVRGNALSEYQNESILGDWNRYYTKYADANQVIMIYPKASRQYNWMTPDDGFFMIPAMLKEVKKSINVDDDKVFITGHSNGATGSFSYLMKQQSPFAGFYGFNTQPKVYTGGTFIRNIQNRSFFNVSTDEDYYFPPDANDTLNVMMKKIGADYQDHRYNGWPHWFPQFDESEPAYPLLFDDLMKRKRNPYQTSLYWECDDLKYGESDWLRINSLDTLGTAKSWHKNINFDILKLVSYDQTRDTVLTTDTLLKAFNFPRKSAAVKANYQNNVFRIESSLTKSITIFISPRMVNMRKPVLVYLNGKKVAQHQPVYDRKFIAERFNRNFDRKALWVDHIDVK